MSTRPTRLHHQRKDSTRKYLKSTKALPVGQTNSISPSNENSVDHQSPVLKKFVDRFRYEDPQSRQNRPSIDEDLWWLKDELETTQNLSIEQSNCKYSDIIEIYPSTDIDDELNKRASMILNQPMILTRSTTITSDLAQVSSNGIGSTLSSTPSTQISSRSSSNRFDRIPVDVKCFNNEEDILYQWRLRRRFEQSQQNQPISFQSKIKKSPIPSTFSVPSSTSNPIEIRREIPMNDRVDVHLDSSPSFLTSKGNVVDLIPRRDLVEVSTQTAQDVSIQTSVILGEPDRQSTKDFPSSPKRKPSPEKFVRSERNLPEELQCSISSSLTGVTSIQINDPILLDEHFSSFDQRDFLDDQILNFLQTKRNHFIAQLKRLDELLSK